MGCLGPTEKTGGGVGGERGSEEMEGKGSDPLGRTIGHALLSP